MRAPLSTFDQFARGWRGYALIALIALASAAFGASRLPPLDADEARFAQASRQMAERGDYLNIRLQDEARNAKPIGVYWLQANAAEAMRPITQRRNTIWPYRLPSILGLVLAAVAAFWGGAALIGRRAAFLGAGLFAAGMLAGFEGMSARADAALLGFTTLAMAALAQLRAPTPARPKLLALVFWAALGCAVLIKGPVAPIVAAGAVGALWLWEKRAAWTAPLLWWPGPVLAMLIAAPWYVAIGLETGGRFFADMLWGDIGAKLFNAQETHFGLPGYHLFLLAFLIFPAAYALPAAGRLIWETVRAPRADDAHAAMRFLIAWAAPIFVLFELAPTKLPHYVLPAYPAIALMCGLGLMAMRGRPWRTAHPAGLVLFAMAGLVIVALTATAATFMPGDLAADMRRAISSALIGLGVIAAALAALMMLRRPTARAGVLIACALALSFSLRERLLPEARELHVSSEAVAALTRARLMPNDARPLWVIGYSEASLVFLTRTDIRLADPANVGAGARAGDAIIIEGRRMRETEAALAARGLAFTLAEPPARGLSLSRGERVVLFVGRISAAADASPPPNP